MKLKRLLKEAADTLKSHGVDDADFDTRELFKASSGLSSAEMLAWLDADVDLIPGFGLKEREIFEENIAERAGRVPLQLILGNTVFMGLPLYVRAGVLIPRHDTETLAETVLREETDTDIGILDLMTGSGCIGIALKKLGGFGRVAASDISREAIDLARLNAGLNGTDLRFYLTDMFEGISESFDVIASNPPYIPSGEIGLLEPEVRDFDPLIALDGGKDGLIFYRRILGECGKVLKRGGRIYLETGADEAGAVGGILGKEGFSDIGVYKDIAGRDRVIRAVLR